MKLIGTGILNWPTEERVDDRYGVVALWPLEDEHRWYPFPMDIVPLDGFRGQLIAKVLEARKSTHIGDLFREIYPVTPEVGEEIILGEGIVFYKVYDDGRTYIGLKPEDGRKTDWLDPKKLYRAHAQYVELYFKECELDLIGSEYGYHCEDCLERGVTTDLDYGEEVNVDGTILCKDCAEKKGVVKNA